MHRCSQRAEGEWAGGPSPPPCGQLTRCFSAVAELLIRFVIFSYPLHIILFASPIRTLDVIRGTVEKMWVC